MSGPSVLTSLELLLPKKKMWSLVLSPHAFQKEDRSISEKWHLDSVVQTTGVKIRKDTSIFTNILAIPAFCIMFYDPKPGGKIL